MFLVALVACSNDNTKAIDAPRPADGRAADAAGSNVPKDAAKVPSTVIVVPNCTGVGSGDIGVTIGTTASDTFSPATATITAGQYVKFTTTDDHNFQNQPGASGSDTFSSGSPGAHTACLQFTVGGSYPFECIVHAGMGMVGTLTVN